jgi:hypothetical protein
MSLGYIRHDEEFYGTAKLTDGTEVLAKMLVVQDTDGTDIVFVSDPAKVHAAETVQDNKRATVIGLKKWMVFSEEDFYIIPETQIISIAPQSIEAKMMYKMFVRQEFDREDIDESEREVEVTASMGLIGKVDQARKSLEDLFNK